MNQCFSGGFIPELRGPSRTVMSSCGELEVSWGRSEDYGEFNYWYFSALTGHKPDDEKSKIVADANNDGAISVTEAYNFARANDSRPETSYFEDNGLLPPHSGDVPSGGDGDRSAKILLVKLKK